MNESLEERIDAAQDGEVIPMTHEELQEINMKPYPHKQPYPDAEFRGFPKIPRLNRDIIITEKIDGTNAQVLITENKQVFAGSRKRWITIKNDNFGFAAWVEEHTDELLRLGPGRHFGEWWGQGIQRNYGLDHRRFSLFNVSRWITLSDVQGQNLTQKQLKEMKLCIAPKCCYVVPILPVAFTNEFDTAEINGVLAWLQKVGSLAASGFMNPEGIVVYHTAGNCCFKVTLENDDKPKGGK